MKENLKLALIAYLFFNMLMMAQGMDEATWLLSNPCAEKKLVAKIFPGYKLGCKLGKEPDDVR